MDTCQLLHTCMSLWQLKPRIITSKHIMTEVIITPEKKRSQCHIQSATKVQEAADNRKNDEERYIVIAYAMQPENPDWHREMCFVLYKGMKTDDVMRTYVAAHIKLTWPPPHIEIKKSAGEVMETTSFVEPHELCAAPCSTLSMHIQERCSHIDKVNSNENILGAYEFEPPIYDHEKYAVRILIVRPRHWHRIRQCLDTHKETQCRHTSFVMTHNNENGETTDMTRVHAMHL